MNLRGYRLQAQLGAGRDGVSYRAIGPDGTTPAEVRVLGAARTDNSRWPRVVKRLRLAALIEHPAALCIRETRPDDDPPHVVLEWVERKPLAEVLRDRVPLHPLNAAILVRDLAAAILAAHRLGLAHGRLAPSRILCPEFPRFKIDFSGLQVEALTDTEFAQLDAACVAPEGRSDEAPDPAADVFALGGIFSWLLGTGADPTDGLLREQRASSPADRPTMREVYDRLAAVVPEPDAPPASGENLGQTLQSEDFPAPPVVAASPSLWERGRGRLREQLAGEPSAVSESVPEQLGRFRLLERLGQGGMGTVYRAEDTADGTTVAVKVLRSDTAARPNALRRFYKEARILAEVNSPNVVNLFEVNQDGGVHYLVMELVAGRNLGDVLEERGRMDESVALAVLADVARGLAEAHARGVIHRDVKPDNILMAEVPKLCDFGLARHVVESESLGVTQVGAVLGTPLYMAPEQASGTAVDPRTDVYSLGATLFHMLAGRPPFSASTPLALVTMHCNDAPPELRKINADLSEGICRLVERMLAKSPDARPADAGAVLRDVERLLRGEPTDVAVHPRLPDCDPANVLRYDFVWELSATPRQLWPHVSNTERLNQAVGLPGVQFTTEEQKNDKAEGVSRRPRRFGRFRKAGMGVAWEEHPFEWVEGRRMGVLREYSEGPFKWLVSVVELTPRPGGGTTLAHRVRIEPRGLLGRTIAAVEVGLRGRRALDRVYRRIDAFVTGKLGGVACADPFEEPPPLSGAQQRRLDALLDRLGERGVAPEVVERLGEFLGQAPAQEVARIRPLALARRLGLEPESVVSACLHGAREGLLVLLWDILCPICRIPAEIKDSLRALREHGRCSACNLDFELDFANSVEMIFRVHPGVRPSDLATYCVGGPAHSPHVAAQVRAAPGERLELELALGEGTYRVRSPQLPFVVNFRVAAAPPDAPPLPHRWELNLSRPPTPERTPTLRAGRQVVEVTHELDRELVVRVERTTGRDDPLTAARAATLAVFRELFPGEVLAPGQLISVSTVTLLVTALDHPGDLYRELGDARAFAVLHEMFRLLHDCVRREGGALVKTVGEGIVAAFADPADAVRASLDLHPLLAAEAATRGLRLRVGVHRGPALAATINEHLDYFGTTVSQAGELLRCVRGGEVVLTQAVAADPQVASLLKARGLEGEVIGPESDTPAARLGLRIAGRPAGSVQLPPSESVPHDRKPFGG